MRIPHFGHWPLPPRALSGTRIIALQYLQVNSIGMRRLSGFHGKLATRIVGEDALMTPRRAALTISLRMPFLWQTCQIEVNDVDQTVQSHHTIGPASREAARCLINCNSQIDDQHEPRPIRTCQSPFIRVDESGILVREWRRDCL